MKLSERGFVLYSEREFGRCLGAKTGPTVQLRCPLRPRFGHLQDFSDSFKAKFAFWGFSEVHIQDPEYPSPSGRCQALPPLALPHPDSLGIAQDSFCPSGA